MKQPKQIHLEFQLSRYHNLSEMPHMSKIAERKRLMFDPRFGNNLDLAFRNNVLNVLKYLTPMRIITEIEKIVFKEYFFIFTK